MIKQIHRILLLLAVPLLAGWDNPFRDPVRVETEAGKEAFMQENYGEALEHYSSALEEAPKSSELQYNIGNVKYKQDSFEEALSAYDLASDAVDPRIASNIYYNQGNTLYRMQKYEEAIEAFKNSLRLNPDDVDAKHNIEYIRYRMAQQQQQQQQQQDQQQQDQEQKEQDEQQQQEQQEQEQQQDEQQKQQQEQQQEEKEQQQQQQQQQSEEEPSGTPEQGQPQKPQPREEDMTKEQAEMILNSLEQKEQEQRKERKEKVRAQYQIQRDW